MTDRRQPPGAPQGAVAVRVDELDRVEVAGVVMRPIRRRLGITAFGMNAYTADRAGDQVIEEHDETSGGAGRHEELYLVLEGRALFTVDGEEIEAPRGSIVFVPDPASRRAARATEEGTTVLVVGGRAGAGLPVSPFEFWFSAEPAYRAGRYADAYAIAAEGLAEHPENATLHYHLACYSALGGDHERAIEHLRRAVALDPQKREWAAEDGDLDSVRGLPGYPA